MFWRLRFFGPLGSTSQELLDRPPTNFDVAGVPTGQWSSRLFCCLQNLVPSCMLSFCCPCIMWGQVVIRSQIPFFIGTKNSFKCLQGKSGYNCFMNTFMALVIIPAGFLVAGLFTQGGLRVFFMSCFSIFMLLLLYVNGHLRTAFKMKYSIPSLLPRGCFLYDCMLDAVIATVCFPCSISQMARHVFQYDRWNPEIGCFISDPYSLDPLEVLESRPEIADTAGLSWANDTQHPDVILHTGAADRIREQQQRQAAAAATNNAVPAAAVYAVPASNQPIFDATGKEIKN